MSERLNECLILGTRGSPLARWQTEQVLHALHTAAPELETEVKVISTKGDQILNLPLAQIGDKGLFTKELEQALYRQEIDLAVHSLKDLPTTLPEGLEIAAILERHSPQDALVCRNGYTLETLPEGALVGTGSLRRRTQLQQLRPDLRFQDLRGNIQTRLGKLDRGDYDAIVMARAALERMGLRERIATIFPPSLMLPAVGQGAIAVETRLGDRQTQEWLSRIHHPETALCSRAERACLKRLGGGCEKPIAAYALLEGDELQLYGYLSSEDGQQFLREHLKGSASEAEKLGIQLAEALLAAGGQDILAES